MPSLNLTVEQVIQLVNQLSPNDKQAVLAALTDESLLKNDLNQEDQSWLDADLDEALPPYDWGLAGIPQSQPVEYLPDHGLVVKGETPFAEPD